MDALSELVAGLELRGRMEWRCLFGGNWSAPHDSTGPWRAPFHVLLSGACEVWLPDTGRSIPLVPGSLLVLPHGMAHTLRPGAATGRMRAVRVEHGGPLPTKTNLAGPAMAEADILCGEFEFGGRRRSALLDALPEVLAVEFTQQPEFAWLEGLVRMMAHEIEQRRAGAAAIVAELSGALFTLAVRAHLDTQAGHAGVLGLLANERLAPALSAMLEAPQQPWTVETLARRCHMSRASFARQFKEWADQSPLELLTRLRMEQAARLLARGGKDTATVGEAVGYQSEAAFNRAFARHAGTTPGRFRRNASTARAAR